MDDNHADSLFYIFQTVPQVLCPVWGSALENGFTLEHVQKSQQVDESIRNCPLKRN